MTGGAVYEACRPGWLSRGSDSTRRLDSIVQGHDIHNQAIIAIVGSELLVSISLGMPSGSFVKDV